jgi:hypothetical protein
MANHIKDLSQDLILLMNLSISFLAELHSASQVRFFPMGFVCLLGLIFTLRV